MRVIAMGDWERRDIPRIHGVEIELYHPLDFEELLEDENPPDLVFFQWGDDLGTLGILGELRLALPSTKFTFVFPGGETTCSEAEAVRHLNGFGCMFAGLNQGAMQRFIDAVEGLIAVSG